MNKFSLSRSRSNSQARNGVTMMSANTSSTSSLTSKYEFSRSTSPRGSNSSSQRPNLFASSSNTSSSTRKRSSSIANAISNFVNLKGHSSSSIRFPPNDALGKIVSLSDLPPPPEPELDESYKDYLTKISLYGKLIGVILTEKENPYKSKALNYFLTNCFDFKELPIDIALRELLMFVELPKETQQIDRLLQEFSNVYYEEHKKDPSSCGCKDSNQVYFVVFSLLMLHTDFYNPNNKQKMSKQEFISLVHEDIDSGGNEIAKDILSYFYDNITTKESPKFDFSKLGFGFPDASDDKEKEKEKEKLTRQPTSLELFLDANEPTLSLYSPKSIIAGRLLSPTDHLPVPQLSSGRSTSASLSTYLGYSGSSSSTGNNNMPARDDIDLYSHICYNTLSDVSMESEVEEVWDPNYLNKPFSRAIDNKCYKFYCILNELKGAYLRIHRDCFGKIANLNYEVLNECEETYLYLKIIQMSEISELSISKKFSIVGNNNKMYWKPLCAILTSYGLLLFENFDWIVPNLVLDERTNTTNYIINFKEGVSSLADSIIEFSDMLAVTSRNELGKTSFSSIFSSELGEDNDDSNIAIQGNTINDILNKEDEDLLLYIQSPTKKYIWKCIVANERDNWVDSINLMASFSGCFIDLNTIYNTVILLMRIKTCDKIEKLKATKQEKLEKLKDKEKNLAFYRQAIPMSIRTKRELIICIKQLAVQMDELIFKIKKSAAYIDIITQMISQRQDHVSYSHSRQNSISINLPSLNLGEKFDSSNFDDKMLHSEK
ncbi:hypothetical protein Kpol_538p3 [Vanderwaltozyma polyspora DSM 70294]|uniref:SEC7 domain-containing protein n=1 Tax=Vanderwaltozyma polyspora (strain ATCC 22028 / DSM 70294 / BCRC 21397 / CBS 2163 / NBRC 10782 / NRRL Y-8283 / UCD 57-17) TaxID=436907 RepID=A7TKB6_VANPO|nr:uncharacterized protein Kpol_538p3 [Vanderwaltozyma polyspora DSM 70294]EDO17243.1 hypothetical protein Kpol_538p3 [Vanderwaltozyma polyspora DSM 70294]